MELWGIVAVLGLILPIIIESRVQIAYIKGKLEVLEKKIDDNFRRREKNGS